MMIIQLHRLIIQIMTIHHQLVLLNQILNLVAVILAVAEAVAVGIAAQVRTIAHLMILEVAVAMIAVHQIQVVHQVQIGSHAPKRAIPPRRLDSEPKQHAFNSNGFDAARTTTR